MDISSSILNQQWQLRVDTAQAERQVQTIVQQQGISEMVARVLVGRGIKAQAAESFLAPTLKASMPDPSHLKDMDKAASRIADAIERREQIAVLGDYDVDGATSTALIARYLAHFNMALFTHIPDRQKEGYGPNVEALQGLKDKGTNLIITVDCGTVAVEVFEEFYSFYNNHLSQAAPSRSEREEQLTQARSVKERCDEWGVKPTILILDHHQGEPQLPPVHAVVNPNRFDENSAHGNLAAVGVTFLTLVAVNRELRNRNYFSEAAEPNLLELLDLVALGTVCDVVPLTALNRAFVTQGLEVMKQRLNLGMCALADIAGIDEPPSTYHLGFIYGPRINAGGRVGESALGSVLLASDDEAECAHIVSLLDGYNKERQAIEANVLEAALVQAESKANIPIIMVMGKGWHEGVIGIVAGRLKEIYHRPSLVVTFDDSGHGKGSARSVVGADIGAAITAARQEGLLSAGGGHAMAAGFSLEQTQYDALEQFLCMRLEGAVSEYSATRSLKIDGWITASGATLQLAQDLEKAAPYGMGNPSPKFALRDVRIIKLDVLKEAHIRCIITDHADAKGKLRLTAMAFGCIDTPLGEALLSVGRAPLHLAGQLKVNRWQGRESAQFIIEDVVGA